MKHLVIAAALLAGGLAWVVFGRGGGASDPLAARDALLAGDVVVTFESLGPGAAEVTTYRLADGRWLTSYRPTPGSGVEPMTMTLNGSGMYQSAGPGCYVPLTLLLDGATAPAGLELADTLLSGIKLDRNGDSVSYARDFRTQEGQPLQEPRFEEDLAEVERGVIRYSMTPFSVPYPAESYTLRRLSDNEAADAEAMIESIRQSDTTTVEVREIGFFPESVARGSNVSTTTVYRDCPALFAEVAGRAMAEHTQQGWVIRDVVPLDTAVQEIDSSVESGDRLFALADASPGSVPLAPGARFLIPYRHLDGDPDPDIDYLVAVEIVSCQETNWFSCGPAEEGETP